MPNPFDSFDVQTNPFDRFDTDIVHQIPGLENSVDSGANLGKDTSTISDKARGVIEAGASAITGIPATIGEGFSQLFGGEPGKVSEKFYQPRTEKGKEYSEAVSEFANRYLNPLLGGLGHVSPEQLARLKKSDPQLVKILEHDSKEVAPRTGNPFDVFDINLDEGSGTGAKTLYADKRGVVTPELPDEALQKAKRENAPTPVDVDLTKGPNDAEGRPIYVDPQGQAFRGSPNEPEAPLALERQTEAADNAMTHNETPMTEEPHGLLSRESFDASNEGPQHPSMQDLLQEQLRQELANKATGSPSGIPFNFKNQGGGIPISWEDRGTTPQPIKTQESSADFLKRVLAEDAKSHVGGLGAPVWIPPKVVPKGQRGAVLFGDTPAKKLIKNTLGLKDLDKNLIPDDPSAADVIKAGLDYGKDNANISKNMDSGATMRYLKSRGNGMIQGIAHIVQNMGKRVDLQTRTVVHPMEKAFRALTKDELSTVADILKLEDSQKRKFSKENIMSNLNLKQQVAYAHAREALDYGYELQNDIRVRLGNDPITKIEGYVAHNFEGDFRRPVWKTVTDANGNTKDKLVGYLAADIKRTKWGLNAQAEAVRKQFPDLKVDSKDDHVIRYYGRNTDFEGAYSKIIDFLGRDDPAVKKLQEYMEMLTTGKAEKVFGQEKHFEDRAGVFGWVGTRPGKNLKSENVAFMEEQVKYIKNAIKWSEAQKTAEVMKEILNNPELREQQPKNMEWARDYWKNAVGFGTNAAVAAVQDSLRHLGTSPDLFEKGIGGLKSYFILDKLAGSFGFMASQMIQTANLIPHMTYMFTKGYRGNPVSALLVGIPSGVLMAGLHFKRLGGNYGAKFMEGLPDTHFLNRMFKYAEDNGVITKSVNDESPIGSAFNPIAGAAKIGSITISGSEAFVRGAVFTTFVQYLKSSGKFKNDTEIFQMAEDHTHAAMVDYRKSERPMIFSKTGTAGNFLNTLQTWGFNWYNQFNFMAREAFSGNLAPGIAALMLAYANGGIMNVPYMADMDKLYDFLKNKIPDTNLWMKVKNDPFWRDPKMWMADNFGESSVWGAVSMHNPWGVSVSSRVTAPTPYEMLQSPAGPITDLARKAASLGHAVVNPTDPTAWKQFATDIAPVAVKGPLETSKLMEGTAYNTKNYEDGTKGYVVGRMSDLNSHTGVYTRDQHDQNVRPFGFRTQKEVTEKEVGYRLTQEQKEAETRSKALVDSFYNAVKNGDQGKMQEFDKVHTLLTGKAIDSKQIEQKLIADYTDTLQRAGIKASKSVSSIQGYARAKAMLDKFTAERQ